MRVRAHGALQSNELAALDGAVLVAYDRSMTTRTITITLNSAISDEQWSAFVEEVEQAACDFAAAMPDDRYEVSIERT